MIDPDSVPATVEAAARQIASSMPDNDRNTIRNNPDADVGTHVSAGLSVRNQWSLWERDSPLKREAATTYGIAHADDISGLIMAWAFAMIRGEEFDPLAHCERYHEHWLRYGTGSLTAGGWPPDARS